MRFMIYSAVALLGTACNEDVKEHHHHHHDHEVMTTVELTFTATTEGAEAQVFTWSDPEDDGNPSIDSIALTSATDYDLTLRFLNEMEEEPEDVTPELKSEDTEHQVFVEGTNVDRSTTEGSTSSFLWDYNDEDSNGLPIGFALSVTAGDAGTGDLTILLRHMPLEDGNTIKTEGLAEAFASEGISVVGGDTDISVTFPFEVTE